MMKKITFILIVSLLITVFSCGCMGPDAKEAMGNAAEEGFSLSSLEEKNIAYRLNERVGRDVEGLAYVLDQEGLDIRKWTNQIPIAAWINADRDITLSMEDRGGDGFYLGPIIVFEETQTFSYGRALIKEGEEITIPNHKWSPVAFWKLSDVGVRLKVRLVDEETWRQKMG